MLGARERDENRTRPGIRGTWHDKTDVARGCGEHRLNHRVIEERVGASTRSRSTSCSVAMRTRSAPGRSVVKAGGPRGHAARPQRLTPLARESTRFGKIGGGSDQLGQDELAHGATCQRLSDARRSSKRVGSMGATRIERSGAASGSMSSAVSCRRIAPSSSFSAGVGSRPSSSTSPCVHVDTRRVRPPGGRTGTGEHQLPRAGRLAKRMLYRERLQLATTSPCRPSARSASIRRSSARGEAPRAVRSTPARNPRTQTPAAALRAKARELLEGWRLRRPGPSRAESATSARSDEGRAGRRRAAGRSREPASRSCRSPAPMPFGAGRHVHAEQCRRVRRLVAPEVLDEAIRGHDLVGMRSKMARERALLCAAKRYRLSPSQTSRGPRTATAAA